MAVTTEKLVVSVVSKDIPLIKCPIGEKLFIKKDKGNRYDAKALSVFVKHKTTGKWTFIGYVANNPEYIPLEGVANTMLHEALGEKDNCIGTVSEKMDVVYPYGLIVTALVVEVDI